MQRVLVIGSGGSGKTTFARRLAATLHLTVIHLDAHYWGPGWTPTPAEQWEREIQQFVSQPSWVMDGNYGGTLDIRLAACDTVIFLDLPRLVCTWRILKRGLRYWGRTRPDVAPGCPERLRWEFIVWVWTYRTRRRPKILQRLRELDTARAVVLTSRTDVERFLAEATEQP
jgi:adenylate kinase family enzyme